MNYTVTNIWTRETSLQGYVTASFARLKQLFGEPMPIVEGDGKVSTQWVLMGSDGSAINVYDYKETDLYSRNLPNIHQFRAKSSYDWHVGAQNKTGADRFIGWLEPQLKEPTVVVVEEPPEQMTIVGRRVNGFDPKTAVIAGRVVDGGVVQIRLDDYSNPEFWADISIPLSFVRQWCRESAVELLS